MTSQTLIRVMAACLLLAGLGYALAACCSQGEPLMADEPAPGPLLVHNVYFTLKDHSPAAVEKLLAACRRHLAGHEGTVFFSCGTLSDLDRSVNDRGFHVALHLVFESRAAHDKYQVHERHQRFIAENRENWSQVRVFDSDCPRD